ncbi:CFA synthetase, thioesterase component [Xenorhabdus mauleonii]|uniref:CFA synthetase, thioesterase component n=1 Tax=Xenorhabdus mauleonii TaxID=351675 RepID=A0A1I3HUM1_9GAMM|nr:alpha/beta fold hydrolase [Xenorhabdus mauleonii]PHM40271.1 CFA synthetase, thioesterase component [Xenorhabdus mauleonii]SFI39250.1 Surfactin synthase thioesterase subunit [Xenorhabdus mauleonii]
MSDSVLFSVIKKPEAEVQLLFLHHAGGSCFSYMELAHKLLSNIEIYTLELAGRGMRIAEPFQTDAETVLSDILASINHLKLGEDKPLLLFGHSLGAELAYHVARKLEHEAPEKKIALILSARGFFEPEDLINDECEEYSDEHVVNIINQCGGTPQDVLSNPELRDYLIRTMKHDLLLLDSLSRLPKTKLNVQTKVIGGSEDNRVHVSQLEMWRKVLPASAEQHVFTGGHFYVFTNKTLIPWLEKQCKEFIK